MHPPIHGMVVLMLMLMLFSRGPSVHAHLPRVVEVDSIVAVERPEISQVFAPGWGTNQGFSSLR